METRTRILLADDHPVFRDGLRQAIVADPSLQIIGEASDGEKALELIEQLLPQIAVLDIAMSKLSGLQVARSLQKLKLPVSVIFITMYNEEDMFNKAMDVGAKGYVLKESAVSDILNSIRAVAEGSYYLSPAISHFLINRSARKGVLAERRPGLEDLTPQERRVLKLIAGDHTSKEIAEQFGVSYRTIETHRTNICNKLKLHGSHSLLRFAFDHRGEL